MLKTGDLLIDRPLGPYGYDSGSVSLEATPLQSSFNSITALAFRFERLPTSGFGPLLDITVARQPTRGFPNPRFVPSSGSHSLSTVYSALQLAGLFHPAAELRTAVPFRGFPLYTAVPSHRRTLPPRRWNKARSPASRLPHTRLPDLEALLRAEPRAAGSVISLAASRSPHRVSRSSRCSSRRRPQFPKVERS